MHWRTSTLPPTTTQPMNRRPRRSLTGRSMMRICRWIPGRSWCMWPVLCGYCLWNHCWREFCFFFQVLGDSRLPQHRPKRRCRASTCGRCWGWPADLCMRKNEKKKSKKSQLNNTAGRGAWVQYRQTFLTLFIHFPLYSGVTGMDDGDVFIFYFFWDDGRFEWRLYTINSSLSLFCYMSLLFYHPIFHVLLGLGHDDHVLSHLGERYLYNNIPYNE